MHKRKLTIIFDAQSMIGLKTGIGYYGYELIRALSELPDVELIGHYYNFLGKNRYDLPDSPVITYKVSKLLHRKIVYLLRRIGITLPIELLVRQRGDVALYLNFVGYRSLRKIPSMPVIYDLAYKECPEFVSARNAADLARLIPATLKRSSACLTISGVSAHAIRRAYPWYTKPVVIGHIPPPAIPVSVTSENKNESTPLMVDRPYFLYLGTIEPRKNILGLLNAYAGLPVAVRSHYSLVLAGGSGWNDLPIRRRIDELRSIGESIVETGYISEHQKDALYRSASAFILVSWHEGYGMPLIEAAGYRIPLVASNLPVFKEILGADNAFYCDPADTQSIRNAMEHALTDRTSAKDMADRQNKKIEALNWRSLAVKVRDTLDNLT